MTIVECVNGHFFDIDTYAVCPHCGAQVKNMKNSKKNKRADKKKGKKADKKQMKQTWEDTPTQRLNPNDIMATNDVFPAAGGNFGNQPASADNQGGTFAFWDTNTFQDTNAFPDTNPFPDTNTFSDVSQNTGENRWGDGDNGGFYNQESVNSQELFHNSEQGGSVSLKEELVNVSSSADGKTFGYFNINRNVSGNASGNENRDLVNVSLGQMAGNMPLQTSTMGEPVVGWLVCIKGAHIGESFNIYAGKNSIGRSNTNKIVISKDNYISRERHAFITYEPRKREYYIQPGDGNGLTYYNGDNILDAKKMEARDEIEIGQSILKLFPLCDQNFSWEDYIK